MSVVLQPRPKPPTVELVKTTTRGPFHGAATVELPIDSTVNSRQGAIYWLNKIASNGKPAYMRKEAWAALPETEREGFYIDPATVNALDPKAQEAEALKTQVALLTRVLATQAPAAPVAPAPAKKA